MSIQLQENKIYNSIVKHSAGAETNISKLQSGDAKYIKSWIDSPIFHALRKHISATEDTDAIAELSAITQQFPQPNFIGRELVAIRRTTEERFKELKTSIGVATEVGKRNSKSIQSKGSRNDYIETEVNRVLECEDSYDRSAMEDDPMKAQNFLVGINAGLMKKETEVILDAVKTNRPSGDNHVVKAGNDTANVDTLITLIERVQSHDYLPNVIAMDVKTAADLKKSSDFKDSTYLRNSGVDYSNGSFAMFENCTLLQSTLMPANTIYCIDSMSFLLYILRRDSLGQAWHSEKEDMSGYKVSTRFGLALSRQDACSWWGAA